MGTAKEQALSLKGIIQQNMPYLCPIRSIFFLTEKDAFFSTLDLETSGSDFQSRKVNNGAFTPDWEKRNS
jgi:hypothetical protein